MTDRLAAVALRLLATRARALGTGDGDALENIITNLLPDGCLCFVTNVGSYYLFRKAATDAPIDSVIIRPLGGPGRWFLFPGFAPPSISSDANVLRTEANAATVPTAAAGLLFWTALPASTFTTEADPTIWSLNASTGVLTYNGPPAKYELFGWATVSPSTDVATIIEMTIDVAGALLGMTTFDPASSLVQSDVIFDLTTAAMMKVVATLSPGQTVRPVFRTDNTVTDILVNRSSVLAKRFE